MLRKRTRCRFQSSRQGGACVYCRTSRCLSNTHNHSSTSSNANTWTHYCMDLTDLSVLQAAAIRTT